MMDKRYGRVEWGPRGERQRTSEAYWKQPRRWNADGPRFLRERGHRRRVFCASLADVFDNKVPKQWRTDLFALIRETRNLDWLLLTKRPTNIAKMLPHDWGQRGYHNVWLGTTAESAVYYQERWPILARIPAAVRFVSYEPAIGPLGPINIDKGNCLPDWIICGGESGGHARLMQSAWARHVRDQCLALGIAYFLKQFGTYANNPLVIERGLSSAQAKQQDPPSNGKGGGLLDGRLHRDFPRERVERLQRRA
jgi:protein gp37